MLPSSMKRLILTALLCSPGCAKETPTYPAPVLPAHGAVARLEVNASPGTGDHGGQASLSIRTLDAYAFPVRTSVELQTSAGSLSASSVTTNDDGLATATVSAPSGTLTITARAGSVSSETMVTIQASAPLPAPTPLPFPNPSPTPDPVIPLTVSIFATPAAAGSATSFGLSTQAMSRADWTFGDGGSTTTTTGSTSHVYGTAGSYMVGVTVTDTRGRVASTSQGVTIAAPPPTSIVVTN
jgi:chitodextrinase